ncbi:MAG: DnaJ domain-containing protein [Acidimicrobiales bacterium]|nr:DnaJ domain-containing protein [Acidimicrobiales bacterium]
MDHYEALGVSEDADPAAIRRAYLAAARRHHPDFHAGADGATRARHASRMQVLNQAWEVLGDPARRSAYDRDRRRASDPGVARRAARDASSEGGPAVPPGKGWTPRSGDDRWMHDFEAWAAERDELPPDEAAGPRPIATVVPVALFALAVLLGFLGLVLTSRPLVAGAAICVALSLGTFVLLPMTEMARNRRR